MLNPWPTHWLLFENDSRSVPQVISPLGMIGNQICNSKFYPLGRFLSLSFRDISWYGCSATWSSTFRYCQFSCIKLYLYHVHIFLFITLVHCVSGIIMRYRLRHGQNSRRKQYETSLDYLFIKLTYTFRACPDLYVHPLCPHSDEMLL